MLDPTKVLARGYGARRKWRRGHRCEKLAVGAELRITFAKGWARSEVKERGGVRPSHETNDGEL